MSIEEISIDLEAKGYSRINNITVLSARVIDENKNALIELTLADNVEGINNKQEKISTNVIYTSAYHLAKVLKENEDMAFASYTFIKRPKGFEVIMKGIQIDLIQQFVTVGELYKYPFTEKEIEGIVFEKDMIINHVVKLTPSNLTLKLLEQLGLKMLGL